MADNTPVPKGALPPPLPAQSQVKKVGGGKVVVKLSSVAKSPPVRTQDPSSDVGPVKVAPQLAPANVSAIGRRPPPLPVKQGVNTPLKKAEPRWNTISGSPVSMPDEKEPSTERKSPASQAVPPPLPAQTTPISARIESKKTTGKIIPPIKLNQPSLQTSSSEESIFLDTDEPESPPKDWKPLEPGELTQSTPDKLQGLDAFTRSQPPLDKPAQTPPQLQDKVVPLKAPESLSSPVQQVRPPPLPVAGPMTGPNVPSLHVAPPMLEKKPDVPAEKLPQPQLPAQVRLDEKASVGISKSPETSEPPKADKVPAVIPTESAPPGLTLKALLAKPAEPSSSPKKVTGPIVLKTEAASPVFTSPAPVSSSQPVKGAEAKPALKPPVFPDRVLAQAKETEIKAPSVETVISPSTPSQSPEKSVAAKPSEMLPVKVVGKTTLATSPAKPSAPVQVTLPAKAPVPLTRAARAQKRRRVETITFYGIFVFVLAALFFGGLYFGRETRVEGQVIPPSGMTLNNEVWIVSDFRDRASGIAEDLAGDRAPLLQEIQERQDHVQRAQADIAAREERIRLIMEEIQASKDEIAALVKQSRDATQQIWDSEGAQLDEEYQSRLDQFQAMIADRAKSLKLKYQPDDSYHSPEVWANAYRLALYEVPPGVDSTKEHQWLADQMNQWRDYLKTLDDRKEQLREKAAQTKLEPAAKITDLNAKVEDLQNRIDNTASEEVPIKAELQQAQAALAQAQTEEAGLDDKYYKQLYALPKENILGSRHYPLAANGRFSWVEEDNAFAGGEKEHHYWIFARATRPDGRQYWALGHFTIAKDHKVCLLIDPDAFVSTKAYLHPNLSSEEQTQ